MRAKKRRAWSIMEAPLVRKLPNSTQRLEPGSWNSKPGDKSTNSTTETKIGPQSADISLHFPCHQFLQMCVERNIQILYIYMGGEWVRNKDNGLVGRRFKDQVTWIHNRRPICLYHVITLEWSDFGWIVIWSFGYAPCLDRVHQRFGPDCLRSGPTIQSIFDAGIRALQVGMAMKRFF